MLTTYELQRPFTPNGGHAFLAGRPPLVAGHAAGAAGVFLTEDGRVLGPREDHHQRIRDVGRGLFSIWGDEAVFFSASDNTDCNENGRSYALITLDEAAFQQLWINAERQLAEHETDLLRAIRRNSTEFNNSFFSNFFNYYNAVGKSLSAHGISLPHTVLELGTGSKPFVGVRFLMEGVSRFIANDVLPIDVRFSETFLQDLRTFTAMIYPDKAPILDTILQRDGTGSLRIAGLETYGNCPFEDIPVADGQVDLVVSVSVLEHVMAAEAVVRRMRCVVKSGGHVWHSIDLRDHRMFWAPLEFLSLTDAEYGPVATENRLRASDFLELFAAHGFEVVEQQFWGLDPRAVRSRADQGSAPVVRYRTLDAVEPWVSEEMRESFSDPFCTKDLRDLSTLGMQVLLRRP